MESNWRFKVWETGWSLSPIRLVARLVNPIDGFDHICWIRAGLVWGIGFGLADMQGYVPNWFFGNFYATPGFPKGFNVEPD